MDCSPPGSSVHGILQARILEWVAISSSRGSSRPRAQTWVSVLAGGFFTAEPPGKPYLLQFLLHTILLCPTFMEEEPRGQGQGGAGGHLEVSRQERYHCSGTVGKNGKGGCPESEEEGPRVRRKRSTGERGPHEPGNPLLCRV